MERELDLEKKVDEYLKELQKDGTWATDYEINKIALCLEANIICYKDIFLGFILVLKIIVNYNNFIY